MFINGASKWGAVSEERSRQQKKTNRRGVVPLLRLPYQETQLMLYYKVMWSTIPPLPSHNANITATLPNPPSVLTVNKTETSSSLSASSIKSWGLPRTSRDTMYIYNTLDCCPCWQRQTFYDSPILEFSETKTKWPKSTPDKALIRSRHQNRWSGPSPTPRRSLYGRSSYRTFLLKRRISKSWLWRLISSSRSTQTSSRRLRPQTRSRNPSPRGSNRLP